MGRPRTPLLDRERITTTALELVDEQGEFSVPQIARRLGVQTGSVYHHVDGRDGIVELLRERVAEAHRRLRPRPPPLGRGPGGVGPLLPRRLRGPPRAIPLLMTSPVRAPRVLAQYERAVALLLDAGFPLPDVMPVIVALENVVLGSALDLAAPVTMWEITDESATPRLAEALDAIGDGRADAAFELALDGFLTHARRRLEAYAQV